MATRSPYARIAAALADLTLSDARALLTRPAADLEAGRLEVPPPSGRHTPPGGALEPTR